MTCSRRARLRALTLAGCLAAPLPAYAQRDSRDIIVTAQRPRDIANPPNSTATLSADQIDETINARTVEDTLKYLPSLVVRKRNIGDTQAPLATRTSGVGASARSLIYADGALLSALIGNNNTIASPRWSLVSPQEIARVSVLYGPFSAAYPGNSIGAVVEIETRLPDGLEGEINAATSLQRFSQYGSRATLPTTSLGATIGDRFGPLAVFASYSRIRSTSQPLAYITAVRPPASSASGSATTGGYDDVNRAGAPIRVLGAGGIEHQVQDFAKLKLALDVTPAIRLSYVGGVFVNDADSTAESYVSGPNGPVYAGTFNSGGYAYTVAPSAFSNNVYSYDERHWSHSLSATGTTGALDWQVIGTLYDFARDEQRLPSTALPGAFAGGAGSIVRLDGTGWSTLDAKASWRAGGGHIANIGVHHDRYTLANNRYTTTDWIAAPQGPLTVASAGRTRTDAVWAQDAWTFLPPLTLTLGGRYEWWRASDGRNFSLAPALDVRQPRREAARFSPKASLAWTPAENWRVSLAFGKAYRFPTVTELYQAVTTGATLSVPNPTLRPERALSEEFAVQYGTGDRTVRLSLFNEEIGDALLSQSAPLVPGSTTLFNYVQNVDRVLTRGVELAVAERDLLPGFDLSGSVTLIDPRIRADAAFPAAIGKRPPQLPLRKATIVATWRPSYAVSLTAAGRYASRSFGTIDNSDSVDFTFQGFGSYVVVDLRAVFRVSRHWQMAVGVDNVANRRYFLFHPFPQRSVGAELTLRL